jgi:transcriptional regulator with XRE-family HTH domain
MRANELSQKLGYAETYVSRLITGEIKEPSAKRVTEICAATGIDWSYILTGSHLADDRAALLKELSEADDDLINDVVSFVRNSGLGRNRDS